MHPDLLFLPDLRAFSSRRRNGAKRPTPRGICGSPDSPSLFFPPVLRGRSGFSLVEVTLALGLVAFAVVAIIGLLPVGLTSLRQSMTQTVESQIVRGIASQSVTSDFTNLTAQNLFYDEEGLPVGTQAAAYYIVNVTEKTPDFPGATEASNLPDSMKSLAIEINVGPNFNLPDSKHYYSLLVANSGR